MKQVIIIRADLKMGKGKAVVQGAHASVRAVSKARKKDLKLWKNAFSPKICLKVNSYEELWLILNQAMFRGLPIGMVIDAAKTVFDSPTFTAIAIGPAKSKLIDELTEELKLL